MSRRSASRERSVLRSSEPALSLMMDESSSLPTDGDARVGFTMVDEDGGVDGFFVDVVAAGLSPNPLPADRDEEKFLLELQVDKDKGARRRWGENLIKVKALAGRTMAVMAPTQRNRNASILAGSSSLKRLPSLCRTSTNLGLCLGNLHKYGNDMAE